MPRLNSCLLRQAYRENPLLPFLLRSCRDLPSSRNELRWLHEYVQSKEHGSYKTVSAARRRRARLRSLCIQRGKGKPLQYIIGTQPFGNLEIICKPAVLIPRQETEAYTIHLGQSIVSGSTTEASELLGSGFNKLAPLQILDLCTGSGCIALLLHELLSPHFSALKLLGIDNSHKAFALALQNLQSNVKSGRLHCDAIRQVRFAEGNLFDENVPRGRWDILIANPPYVSPQGFAKDTSLSVRRYEPRTALIPSKCSVVAGSPNTGGSDQDVGDAFYPRLLEISQQVKAKLVVMEVADMHQAQRVACLAFNHNPHAQCAIWRDWPEQASSRQEMFRLRGKTVEVFGEGNGRAVIVKTNFQEVAS